MQEYGTKNTIARVDAKILNNVTFEDVRKFFKIRFHSISNTLSE